jgi:hypothetical protein
MNRVLKAGLDYRPVLAFQLRCHARGEGEQLLAHRQENGRKRVPEHLNRNRLATRLFEFEFRRGSVRQDEALSRRVQRPES